MAYITGSITDANPGPALHTLMATALTTAGFTLVDTVTISTRTHKVWKSPAAGNVQNLDWYLDVGYTTTGAGTITLQPFEFFDPATDLGYRGSFCANITTIDAATSSRYGATGYALETNWVGATTFTSYSTALVTSAFGYWMSITPDRIIMLLSNDATAVTYVGFYLPDSLYSAKAGAGLYPLVGFRLPSAAGGTSSAGLTLGALARIPPVTTLTGTGWAESLKVPILPGEVRQGLPPLPSGSTAAYPFAAYPVELLAGGTGAGTLFARYGTLRDIAQVPVGGTVIRGDTATVGGAQWVLSSSNNSQSVLFRAA